MYMCVWRVWGFFCGKGACVWAVPARLSEHPSTSSVCVCGWVFLNVNIWLNVHLHTPQVSSAAVYVCIELTGCVKVKYFQNLSVFALSSALACAFSGFWMFYLCSNHIYFSFSLKSEEITDPWYHGPNCDRLHPKLSSVTGLNSLVQQVWSCRGLESKKVSEKAFRAIVSPE